MVSVFLGFMVPQGEELATSGYGGDSQTGGKSPKCPSGLDSQPALSLQDWQLLAGDWQITAVSWFLPLPLTPIYQAGLRRRTDLVSRDSSGTR